MDSTVYPILGKIAYITNQPETVSYCWCCSIIIYAHIFL